ncbi:MAG: hypothetical protein D6826_04610 [Alphaproteobacteria bacterium]|nr:MAG: hypothetical protein D6826_04610 [Alphaproteobacteria bacterium]
MVGIAAGMVALLVTVSAFLYFAITTILAWKLAVEGPETRRELGIPLLPVFFQNLGIPLAVLGFAVRTTEISALGAVMIVIGVLLRSERSVALHPAVEAPLVGLAAVALGAVGIFYGLV